MKKEDECKVNEGATRTADRKGVEARPRHEKGKVRPRNEKGENGGTGAGEHCRAKRGAENGRRGKCEQGRHTGSRYPNRAGKTPKRHDRKPKTVSAHGRKTGKTRWACASAQEKQGEPKRGGRAPTPARDEKRPPTARRRAPCSAGSGRAGGEPRSQSEGPHAARPGATGKCGKGTQPSAAYAPPPQGKAGPAPGPGTGTYTRPTGRPGHWDPADPGATRQPRPEAASRAPGRDRWGPGRPPGPHHGRRRALPTSAA